MGLGIEEGLPDLWYCAWLLAGLLGAAAYGWVGYRLMRRLLGYRKFRGSWYNDGDYRQLLRLIYEDNRRGVAMRDDEVRALRAWLEDDSNWPGWLGMESSLKADRSRSRERVALAYRGVRPNARA